LLWKEVFLESFKTFRAFQLIYLTRHIVSSCEYVLVLTTLKHKTQLLFCSVWLVTLSHLVSMY